MTVETRPLAEITQDALRILYHQLGVVDTVRFLNQFTTGYGNYTEERRAIVESMTLDDLEKEIRTYQLGRSDDA